MFVENKELYRFNNNPDYSYIWKAKLGNNR